MNILDLPPEVIYHIISYLSIRFTMRLIGTCRYFNFMYHNDLVLIEEIKRKQTVEPEFMHLSELLSSPQCRPNFLKYLQKAKITENDRIRLSYGKDAKFISFEELKQRDQKYRNHRKI